MTGHTNECGVWETRRADTPQPCTCGYVAQLHAEDERKRAAFERWKTTAWASQTQRDARHDARMAPSERGKPPLRTRVGPWWQEEMHVQGEDGQHLGELVMRVPAVGPVGPHLTVSAHIEPEPGILPVDSLP